MRGHCQGLTQKAVLWILMIFVIAVTLTCVRVVNNSVNLMLSDNTHYLCPFFRGGLGNLMFMYASLYGIAKTKNTVLLLDSKDYINSVFPNLEVLKINNSKVICNKATVIHEEMPCAFGNHTYDFDNTKNTLHRSYLQSYKYFEDHENSIRKQFRFTKTVQDQAQALINNLTKIYAKTVNNDTSNLQIIGVHIRRGDYLEKSKIKYGYITVAMDYMNKAFAYYRNIFKNCMFIVFTSPSKADQEWRKENIKGKDIFYAPLNSREVDLCALSKCNHSIVTVGTFGWWGAWLANGMTVYFKEVARNGSELRGDFSKDMKDFFPQRWIPL